MEIKIDFDGLIKGPSKEFVSRVVQKTMSQVKFKDSVPIFIDDLESILYTLYSQGYKLGLTDSLNGLRKALKEHNINLVIID